VIKACVEAANADGRINAAEGELVRMVAATLDCPVPPLLAEAA
jgi:tellurite resistance protein